MTHINHSTLLPYSAEQMYRLVNNINSYPEFLPGCIGIQILSISKQEIIASIKFSMAGIRKTFVTCNTLMDNQSIHMNLVNGPFRRLNGNWMFISLGRDACKVEFNLEFEFTNILIEIAFRDRFRKIVNSLIQAFTYRAREVYRA